MVARSHLYEIAAAAEALRGAEAILLIHFSARYKQADILSNLEARLPPHLWKRVTPLLEGFA